MADLPFYLTYDDVLLLPQYSEILPKDVDTRTNLTKHIKLNVPLLSAAMDTVTEHELAIKLALYGGMGIIHKNLTPDEQAEEVDLVKRFENGFIRSPICAKPDDLIKDVYEIRKKYGEVPNVEIDCRECMVKYQTSMKSACPEWDRECKTRFE